MTIRKLAALFAVSMCLATTVACGAAPDEGPGTASVERSLTTEHGNYFVSSDHLADGGHVAHVYRKSDGIEVARVLQLPGMQPAVTTTPAAGLAADLTIGTAPPERVALIIAQSEIATPETLPTWNLVVAYMVSARLDRPATK